MKLTGTNKNTLRLGAVLVALPVFAFSLITVPLQPALTDTGGLLANAVVGVFAGVEANPYNTKAQQLLEKENELNAREAALQESTNASSSVSLEDWYARAALAVSFLVLVLVALNFYFDIRRGGRGGGQMYAVNLKNR